MMGEEWPGSIVEPTMLSMDDIMLSTDNIVDHLAADAASGSD